MSVLYSHSNERQRHNDLVHLLFSPLLEYLSGVQKAKLVLSKKPDWATHMPNRSWRRHSALLTQLHERQQER